MVDPKRQEAGKKGGSMRQKRLRLERARDLATRIARELDRRALLADSNTETPLTAAHLQGVVDVIVPILHGVINPYPPAIRHDSPGEEGSYAR